MMQVFAMNDCDWVAAETAEQAIAFYLKRIANGEDSPATRAEFLEEPIEALSAEQMSSLKYFDEDRQKTGSFAEQLDFDIKAGMSFPAIFATTEY